MRKILLPSLSLAALVLMADANAASYSHEAPEFVDYLKRCGASKDHCDSAIIKLLEAETAIWGGVAQSYKAGFESLKENRPELVFTPDAIGQLGVENRGDQGVKPVLRLNNQDSPWDLLLTLSHEMHHYESLMSRLPKIRSDNLVQGCITKYRFEGLLDETPAYQSEIRFWKDSPDWFKKHFVGQSRIWALLDGQKLSYSGYYHALEIKMASDPFFIPKKYIASTRYPKCALNLLKSN